MFEELRKGLRKEMNNLADDLSTGSAESFEQYRFMVGKIEGLALAERMILDVLERIERLDSDT